MKTLGEYGLTMTVHCCATVPELWLWVLSIWSSPAPAQLKSALLCQ